MNRETCKKKRLLSMIVAFAMVLSLFAGVGASKQAKAEGITPEQETYNYTELQNGQIIYPGDTLVNDISGNSVNITIRDRNYGYYGSIASNSSMVFKNSYTVKDDMNYRIESDAWKVMKTESKVYFVKEADATWTELITDEVSDPSRAEGTDYYTITLDKEDGYRYFYIVMDIYEQYYPAGMTYTNEELKGVPARFNPQVSSEVQSTSPLAEITVNFKEITADSFDVESSVYGTVYKFKKDTDVEGKTDNYLLTGAVFFATEKIARDVTVEDTENGTVTATVNDAPATKVEEVETVYLTLTPEDGYEVDTVSVKDAEGNEIFVEEDGSFLMPRSAVTISVTFAKEAPATYTVTLDRTNYAEGYVDLYTYDSAGSNVANTQENNAAIAMPEGGKVRVFADSEFTVAAEGATVSEMLSADEEGYYYELTGITADTTVVVNKVTTQEQTYELTIDSTNLAEEASLAAVKFDSEGYDMGDVIALTNGSTVEIPKDGGLLVMSNSSNFNVTVSDTTLATVSDLIVGDAESGYYISEIRGNITVVVESTTQGGGNENPPAGGVTGDISSVTITNHIFDDIFADIQDGTLNSYSNEDLYLHAWPKVTVLNKNGEVLETYINNPYIAHRTNSGWEVCDCGNTLNDSEHGILLLFQTDYNHGNDQEDLTSIVSIDSDTLVIDKAWVDYSIYSRTGAIYVAIVPGTSGGTECDHDWEVLYDADDHYRKCVDCQQEADRAAHTFTNNVCSICGYEKKYTITIERVNFDEGENIDLRYNLYDINQDRKSTKVQLNNQTSFEVLVGETFDIFIYEAIDYDYTVTLKSGTADFGYWDWDDSTYGTPIYQAVSLDSDITIVLTKIVEGGDEGGENPPAGFTLTMTNKSDYPEGAVYISKENGLTAGSLVSIYIYAPEGYEYSSDMRTEIKNSIKLDGAKLYDLNIRSNSVKIELYGFTKDATIEVTAKPKEILEIYIDFNTYLSKVDLHGPNWTWDGETHTLTLNGVNIEAEDGYNAIQVPYGTTIVLAEGTRNVISGYSHGFYIREGLSDSLYVKITGTGTLEIENCSTGIYVSDGNLIFEQGTVIVDSDINVQKVAGGSNPQNSITFTPNAKVKVWGEIYNCPINADGCTITGAVFKDADGNEYTEYKDGIWKMVQEEEGKPILINFPEEEEPTPEPTPNPTPDPNPDPDPNPTPNPDPTPDPNPTPVVPSCNHDWIEATCESYSYCRYCSAWKAPALGHDWSAATCTEAKTCDRCGETEGEALGHDWSGEWTVIKEATATEEGKQELLCARGCGQKKVVAIPVIGVEAEPDDNGNLEKDAEVAPEAPIEEATLDNKKSELIEASGIFTEKEKKEVEKGADARVWIEISKTNEATIVAKDKEEIKKEAEKIMGEKATINYFDADLFKQVGDGAKTQISEPGIAMKITIKIPKNLQNHDKKVVREYKILRLHDGIVDVLDGSFDALTGDFSFQSNKFSTYAIAYIDTLAEDVNEPEDGEDDVTTPEDGNEDVTTPEDGGEDVTEPEDGGEDVTKPEEDEKDDVPKTGEGANAPLMWTLFLLLAAAIVAYGKKWKESHE